MRRRLFDFLKKAKRAPSRPPVGKVEIFSRHCLSSEISKKKKRPVGFSRERCFRNLLDTSPREEANITVFLDRGEHFLEEDHFLKKFQPLITVDARSEAAAFLSLAYYIASLKLHPDTILYLVEDDYLHPSCFHHHFCHHRRRDHDHHVGGRRSRLRGLRCLLQAVRQRPGAAELRHYHLAP
jgi:hypothetical protein